MRGNPAKNVSGGRNAERACRNANKTDIATAHKGECCGCNFGGLANSASESHGFASRPRDRFAFIDLLPGEEGAERALISPKILYVEKRPESKNLGCSIAGITRRGSGRG
jgi:hypothetical protein